ncbi:MAG TPA: hypothetical protein VK338_04005, partial [Candidatus Nitrosocosmicus sp.]|nr:hypothetical protein [Candidatus Nitrosocosmicus sp.]
TYARETDTILSSLISDKKIIKLKTIDNLEIYQTTKTYPSIKVQSELPFVAPPYRLQEFDHSYSQLGDYQTSTNTNVPSDFFYPFRNVMDKSERVKPDILQVDSTTNSYFIQNKISNQHKKIFIPSYLSTEESLFTNLYISKSKIRNTYTLTFELLLPKKFTDPITYYAQFPSTSPTISFKLNGKSFKIDKSVLSSDPIYIGQAFIFTRIPNYLNNQEIKLVFDSNPNLKGPAPLFAKFPLQKITYTATDIYKSRINEDGIKFNDNKVTFKNNNYQTGIYLDLSYLPHNSGYFLIFKARNKTGLPLRFCFKNLYSNLCSIYDELSKKNTFTNDYFLIPPSDDGMGYGLSIDNISFGFYDSENEIEEITIIPFPHNFLSQIYFYNKMIPVADSELIIKKTDHSKPYKWEIKTSGNLDNGILTLNQSFHPGWKAYVLTSNNLPFIFGKELTEHKLINNWANGWVLRPNLGNPEKIIIVFWPQYLQFMGYGLVVVFIISILSIHLHTHRTHRKKS